jgi:hypothetical protein
MFLLKLLSSYPFPNILFIRVVFPDFFLPIITMLDLPNNSSFYISLPVKLEFIVLMKSSINIYTNLYYLFL